MCTLEQLENKLKEDCKLNEDIDEDCKCGICSDVYDKNDENYHELTCKHAFHYSCIDKYFRTIKLNNKYVSSTVNQRECPYCRTVSSLLPVKLDIVPMKGIHKITSVKKDANLCLKRCIATCKTGYKCKNKGNSKYSGYCGIHKNLAE